MDDGSRLNDLLVDGEHEQALDLAFTVLERAAFRLAGLAFSHWRAAGAPDATGWPAEVRGSLSLGHTRQVVQFCSAVDPLLPPGKLPFPSVVRIADVIAAVESAAAGRTSRELRSARFQLSEAVGSAKRTKPNRSLTAALDIIGRLRNKTAHIDGRPDPWPDEHPDYPRLFAPLLVAAAEEILTHPQITTPLDGLMVARLEGVSRTLDRARLPMLRFTPDAGGLQAAFFTHANGLSAISTDDPDMVEIARLPSGELERLRPTFVVRTTRDPAQVIPLMLFYDLAKGAPRNPITGEPLILGAPAGARG